MNTVGYVRVPQTNKRFRSKPRRRSSGAMALSVRRAIQLSLLLILLFNFVSLAQPPNSRQSSATPSGPKGREAAVKHLMLVRADVHIEVIAQGTGPVIVILPSLGRGAEDYDVVAAQLAADGFRVLRPQPRGIGASTGPMANLSLHDYAADVATVIEHEGKGPVVVVGHAIGNFVTRMLATDRPDLVRGVVLAAASAGKVPSGVREPPISPEVREAIDKSGDLSLTDGERLRYLALAFFAPGNDPHVWLGGWHPEAMKAETMAWESTPVDLWFACGQARILDLQAENDTVAPRKFAGVLKAALGDRVTIVVVPHAGHALAPEQPRAMAEAIAAFARRL
jgi:pimeloyl-ACP methyl ester carboxylesterase